MQPPLLCPLGQATPSNGLQRSGLEQCGKLCFPAKRGFEMALRLITSPYSVRLALASWGGLRKQASLSHHLPPSLQAEAQ